MPLAEWSGKGAVEHQQHNFLTFEVRQGEGVPGKIGKGEIRCGLVERDAGHKSLSDLEFMLSIITTN